ncbi:TraR/DksA family transcriptional regulator [Desulfohalovibrio reitneri]|uniref:TraR/DksA family transcriptional regulator n=1 Tax=Desulfohalovibrio reitneri TaxID=1307759 RepID=UPI00054E4994|nr:TraR/DksA family transcriptional regulator [Desulfohalovibrio reitneri]
MADEVDRAQASEAAFLRSALGSRSASSGEGPEWCGGVPCCRDCGDPIPPARMTAVPDCSRCTTCQEETEAD